MIGIRRGDAIRKESLARLWEGLARGPPRDAQLPSWAAAVG